MDKINRNNLHYKLIISGRVHGVGFRYSAQNQARIFGIKGFVKNMSDGTVYLEIEGTQIATTQMIAWCNTGPGTAYVEKVQITEGDPVNYEDFKLKY